jgi:PleD family two-component response regulator
MKEPLKILFVEDVYADAELIWHELSRSNIIFEKKLVDNKKDYLSALESFTPDLIISDYSLPQFDGMSALLLKNDLRPFTPFILVTGSINEEIAVESMKAGADDYVIKQNLSRLGPAIMASIKKKELLFEKESAEQALKQKVEELEQFNDLTVNRELRMVELKKEVNKLLREAGRDEKYKIVE